MIRFKDITITEAVPLHEYTTLKVGGPAEFFAAVADEKELRQALEFAAERGISVTSLGGGSNILVSDGGLKGLVIKNEIKGIKTISNNEESVILKVGAGEKWDDLVAYTTSQNLWGLENLSGIPGTVGGAIVQNINAYGVTVANMVAEVEALHVESGKPCSFSPVECEFEYRDSFFKRPGKGKEYMVTGVTFTLSLERKAVTEYRSSSQSIEGFLIEKNIKDPQPSDIREAVLFIRAGIGMIEGMYQSAGSFFKNPIVDKEVFKKVEDTINNQHPDLAAKFNPWHWSVNERLEKISAAFLMECTPYNKTAYGHKAYKESVGISPVHTLSIINKGGATADDIKEFVNEISDTVQKKFNIKLESEVCIL